MKNNPKRFELLRNAINTKFFKHPGWFNHSRWTTEKWRQYEKKEGLTHTFTKKVFSWHIKCTSAGVTNCHFDDFRNNVTFRMEQNNAEGLGSLLSRSESQNYQQTEMNMEPQYKNSPKNTGFKICQKHFLENVPLKPEWFPVLKFLYSKNS